MKSDSGPVTSASLCDLPALSATLQSVKQFSLPFLLTSRPALFDPHQLRSLPTSVEDVSHSSSGFQAERKRLPRNMSLKKNHEVDVMASSLLRLRHQVGFDTLVDVGCGLGYLEEELRLKLVGNDDESVTLGESMNLNELRMVGIEGSEAFLRSSHVRRRKMFPDSDQWSSHSVVARISSAQELSTTIADVSSSSREVDSVRDGSNRYFLCGLHACGGLTSSTLKSFVELNRRVPRGTFCAGIYIVSCCYHKMMER